MLVLLRLGLSEVAQNLDNRQVRQGTTFCRYPICDTSTSTEILTTDRGRRKFVHDIKLVEHISVSATLCIYIYAYISYSNPIECHEALLFMVTCLIFRHTDLQYPKTCELHPSIYLFLLLSPMIYLFYHIPFGIQTWLENPPFSVIFPPFCLQFYIPFIAAATASGSMQVSSQLLSIRWRTLISPGHPREKKAGILWVLSRSISMDQLQITYRLTID